MNSWLLGYQQPTRNKTWSNCFTNPGVCLALKEMALIKHLEIKTFTYVVSRLQKCYVCYKNQVLNFWTLIAWPTTKKVAFKICRMTSSWDKLNIAPTGLVRWNLPFWLGRFAAHRPWKSQGSGNVQGHKINAETAQATLLMSSESCVSMSCWTQQVPLVMSVADQMCLFGEHFGKYNIFLCRSAP